MNIVWQISDMHCCGIVRADVPARAINSMPGMRVNCTQAMMLSQIVNTDVVVFQRSTGPSGRGWMEAAKTRGAICIYDIDDDLFNIPEHMRDAHVYFNHPEIKDGIKSMLAAADAVTVSMPELGRVIRRYTNKPIYVVRNAIDHGHVSATVPAKQRSDRVLVGWHGSQVHRADSGFLDDFMDEVMKARDNVDLLLIGNFSPDLYPKIGNNPRVKFEGWSSPTSLYASIRRYDIGLAIVDDTPFNRCKSEIKWAELSSVGVPTVGSDVLPYAEVNNMVKLPWEKSRWVEALLDLVDNPDKRELLGAKAQIECIRKHDHHDIAKQWVDVFKDTMR